MGNPESKQFNKYNTLPRQNHELTQKRRREEGNIKKFPDEIEDDGTPVDECPLYEKQSEPCKLSGLPGELLSELGPVDDNKPLLNVADKVTEDRQSVKQKIDIKQNPEIQRMDTDVSVKEVKDCCDKLYKRDYTENNIEKGTALDQVEKLTLVVTRDIAEKQDAPLIELGIESQNVGVNESDDGSKDGHLIDLASASQYDPLLYLRDNKSKQYSQYLNQDQDLNDFNNKGSSSEANKDTCSLKGGRNAEISSLEGHARDVVEQFDFPGEHVFAVVDSRDSTAETGSMNSLNSSSSSFSTSSSRSYRTRDTFSIKRLFRPFERKNDNKGVNVSAESGTGEIVNLKCSINHAENKLVETSIAEKEKGINIVFGHDLPIENKRGYRQKLTWRTNDNRLQMIESGNEEDPRKPCGIYSNVIFLPDKMKGTSPKRKSPKKLGSIIQKVIRTESDSDSQSISSKSDTLSLVMYDNENYISKSGLNTKELPIKDTSKILPIPRPDTFRNQLEFVDDHFGLYTGCSASGILKDILDADLYKDGQCYSSIDQNQSEAENEIKDSTFRIQTSAKGCEDAIFKNLTRFSEDPKFSYDKIEHYDNQKPVKFDMGNKPVHFVPKEARKSFSGGSRTYKEVEVSNTSEMTQRTICQTISPPTFRKNCNFNINWNILRSNQGHFARNMKSSVTNIAEDNRICLEFCLPFYGGKIDKSKNLGCELNERRFDYDDTPNVNFSDEMAKSQCGTSHIEVIVNDFDDDDNELSSVTNQSRFASRDKSDTFHIKILKENKEIYADLSLEISESSENGNDEHATESPRVFSFEQEHVMNNFANARKSHKMLEIDSSQNTSSSPLSFRHKQGLTSDISNNGLMSKYTSGLTENNANLLETQEDKKILKTRNKEELVIRDKTSIDASVIGSEKSHKTLREGEFYPDKPVVHSEDSAQDFGTIVSFQRFRTGCEHKNMLTLHDDVDEAVICSENEVQRHMRDTCNNKIPDIDKVKKSSHASAAEKISELDSTKHHSGLKIVNDSLTEENGVQLEKRDKMETYDTEQLENVKHFEQVGDAINRNVYYEQIDDNKASENLNTEHEYKLAINGNSQQNNLVSGHTNNAFSSVDISDGFCNISEDCAVRQQEPVKRETYDCVNKSTSVKVGVKQLYDNELMKQSQVNLEAMTNKRNDDSFGKDKNSGTNSNSRNSTEVRTNVNTETNMQSIEIDSQIEAADTNSSMSNVKSKESDASIGINKIEDPEGARRSYASRYKSKKTKEREDNRLIQIYYEEDVVIQKTQIEYSDTDASQNKTEKSDKGDSSGTIGFASFLKPLFGMVDQLLPDEYKQHMHGVKMADMISDFDFRGIYFNLPPHEFQRKLEEQQSKYTQKLLKKFNEIEDETGSQIIQNQNQSTQKSEDLEKTSTCEATEGDIRENEEIDPDKDSDLSLPQSDDEEIELLPHLEDANWDAVVRLETIKCRQATESPHRLRCTVLCVDISGSMVGEPWKQMRGVLQTFVKGIEDVRVKHGTTELVSIVTFGHETKVALTPTTDYNKVMDTFDKLEVNGNTPLEPVLLLALFPVLDTSNSRYHHHLYGTQVRHRVVLLTDGHPTPQQMFSENDFVTDRQEKNSVAAIVKRMKFLNSQNLRDIMNIYCVPIGRNPNMDLLEIISKKSGGQIVPRTDIQRLSTSTHNYLTSLQITRHLLDSGAQAIDKKVLESIINTLYPDISSESMDQMIYEIEYEFKKDRKQKKKERNKSSGLITDEAGDSDSDSDESLNRNADENDRLAEVEEMPKIGTRVKRGPDFDSTEIVVVSETGTITGHSVRGKRCLFVLWDCGVKTYCRYGETDCYDVMIDDVQHIPCKLEDRIKVGHRVRRGPDWQYNNQDGGSDQLGTVYHIHDNDAALRVRWDNGNFGLYRYNYDGAYDVLLSTPDDPFDVLRHTHEMNRRNLAKTRGIDINSTVNYRQERLDLDLTESLFGLDLDKATKGQGDTGLNKNEFVRHRKEQAECMNT